MSPEQARGKAVDRRAKIWWAFGVVLFEMLTGRRLFAGETVSDILPAVLKEEPPWGELPPGLPLPLPLQRVLRRCLRKQARDRDRFHDIADVRLEPREAPEAATSAAAAAPGGGKRFLYLWRDQSRDRRGGSLMATTIPRHRRLIPGGKPIEDPPDRHLGR